MAGRNSFFAWPLLWAGLVSIAAWGGAEAQDSDPAQSYDVTQKLEQKIRMIEHILNSPALQERTAASEDSVAQELLARARQNFAEGKVYYAESRYLEADAVLDYVLRDLSASSQLLSLSLRKQAEYRRFVSQLDAFTLPEREQLEEDDVLFVEQQLSRISDMRAKADQLAEAGDFDRAIAAIERAYGAKVTLVQRLLRDTTLVYDLDFDTVQDEYRYLVSRNYHYLDMVDLAVSRQPLADNVQKLTDFYLYRSMVNLERAESLETDGRFSEAIPILEESITQLTRILKLLGVDV